MQQKVFTFSCFFNLTLAALFASAFLIPIPILTNINYQLFDLVIAIYATVVPAIGSCDDKLLNQKFSISKFRIGKKNSIKNLTTSPRNIQIKTVFGVEIVKSKTDMTQAYFSQLSRTWN